MRLKLSMLGASILIAASIPAVAHHSFDAEFDRSKPVTLKGKVTKVGMDEPARVGLSRGARRGRQSRKVAMRVWGSERTEALGLEPRVSQRR